MVVAFDINRRAERGRSPKEVVRAMVRAVVCYIFIDYSTMVLGIRLDAVFEHGMNRVRTWNRRRHGRRSQQLR